MSKRNTYTILFLTLLCHFGWSSPTVIAATPQKSAYEKLFDGKKVSSSEGLVNLHLIEGKVYGEIPYSLLDKELKYLSVIEKTSDNGEGAVGQHSDHSVSLIFTLKDSTIYATLPNASVLENKTTDQHVRKSLEQNRIPGLWKQFKVLAITPDSSAVVAEMTSMFTEEFSQMGTFPMNAYNSMGGMIMRTHDPIAGQSYIEEVHSEPHYSSVLCNTSYKMNGFVYGVMRITTDYTLHAHIRKILLLPNETPMQVRYADSRVGTDKVGVNRYESPLKPLTKTWYATRWNIQAKGKERPSKENPVDVQRPITFYMDTLLPPQWKPYIREGALEWNKPFAAIGFKDVIRVEEFPSNPGFKSTDPLISTIRYSPDGNNKFDCSMLKEENTGEIRSATICLHSNSLEKFTCQMMQQLAAADQAVRTTNPNSEEVGRIIKTITMQAVGKCLGLVENSGASYAYPVDSLRSATFTARYGLTPSAMERTVFNSIAQPEDLAKGVKSVQEEPGPADYFTIDWLYSPNEGMTPEEEVKVLNRKIEQSKEEPYLRFRHFQTAQTLYDPTAMSGDLGDDIFKSISYQIENQKRLAENFYRWFKEGDETMEVRIRVFESLTEQYARNLMILQRYIGGFFLNDIRECDKEDAYTPIGHDTQKRAALFIIRSLKELDWLNQVPKHLFPVGTTEYIADIYRQNIMSSTLDRIGNVAFCSKLSDDQFTPEEFLEIFLEEIFDFEDPSLPPRFELLWQEQLTDRLLLYSGLEPRRKAKEMKERMEQAQRAKAVQYSFYGTAGADEQNCGERTEQAAYYPTQPKNMDMNKFNIEAWALERCMELKKQLEASIPHAKDELRDHYEYLLFKIKRTL